MCNTHSTKQTNKQRFFKFVLQTQLQKGAKGRLTNSMNSTTKAVVKANTPAVTIDAGKTSTKHWSQQQQMLQVKLQSNVGGKIVNNTLHHALGPFLVLSRFFGVLPVMGIWPSNDVEQVYFKWLTVPVLVTAASIAFASMDLFLTFRVLAEKGLKLTTSAPVSFSIECLTAFIVFLCLSRNWPNLIKSTSRLEIIFSHQIYTCKDSQKFSQRIRFTGWMLILCATVEHSFYVISGIYSNHVQIKQCNLTVDFWHNYFLRERLQIFSLVDYTAWMIPLIQWITTAMTFVWNFIDIFLILVCHGLAARFHQFHWCLQTHLKMKMSNEFWQKVRQDFLKLSDLLCEYDGKLSGLILLSSAQNMYFLAVQIFYSFLNHGNFMNDMYFWVLFTYVAFRSYYMMSSASRIDDAANEIRSTMYEIPTDHWCLEFKRLNEVIVSDLFALSGRGFFFLTRRLIFAMAGTLVVYELVLLDQVDGADVTTPFCSRIFGQN